MQNLLKLTFFMFTNFLWVHKRMAQDGTLDTAPTYTMLYWNRDELCENYSLILIGSVFDSWSNHNSIIKLTEQIYALIQKLR